MTLDTEESSAPPDTITSSECTSLVWSSPVRSASCTASSMHSLYMPDLNKELLLYENGGVSPCHLPVGLSHCWRTTQSPWLSPAAAQAGFVSVTQLAGEGNKVTRCARRQESMPLACSLPNCPVSLPLVESSQDRRLSGGSTSACAAGLPRHSPMLTYPILQVGA
eukprot:TRINITY_DN27114_c0_g1_i4.p1 TRINITY_DN27114_c0_g1~~TRINITY_DN27114_c0_g1_i4.p1  ORF type:complete len:165 (+),score=3.23 TRINITY_DN27114_c0_g1_i4:76-570(+)